MNPPQAHHYHPQLLRLLGPTTPRGTNYRRDGACPVSTNEKAPSFEQGGDGACSPHHFQPSTFHPLTISFLPYGESFVSQRLAGELARYTFSAKEKDLETGYSYFGARYYESSLSIWLSVDPLSDKYPSVTNYIYCRNNPIIVIDPNGMDEWEINRQGQRWVKETKEHTLYALGKDGKRTGASLTLSDRAIFDGLAATGRDSRYTNSHASGDENSQESMLKTFKFAADNSKVEWRVDRFSENNETKYAVGTAHDPGEAPSAEQMGHSYKDVVAFIHSHPNVSGVTWEVQSMGWRGNGRIGGDVYYKTKLPGYANVGYYTYFPNSHNLWSVRSNKSPAYIRNIKSYSGFYFGVMNTR